VARTGRPRAFDRDQAIQSAMHLFWQHGYEATSLAQLKAGMGNIAAPSFYAAFGSKEQLFSEVVTCYIATHGQVMSPLRDASLSPRQAIETALRRSARMQTESSHPAGCLLALSTSIFPPDSEALQKQLNRKREQTRADMLTCVQRAVAQGDLPPATDANVMATLFNTFLQGMTAMAREGVDLATLDAAITCLFAAWLSDIPVSLRCKF